MDFPDTRSIIARLPAWVDQFTGVLPAPNKNHLDSGGFRWRHKVENHQTLLVTKAVRIASGLRAAMLLADYGHTVEAATLLRTVADFSAEIMFVSEGVLEGRFTNDQAKFIEQHHAAPPTSADELAAREREYYVGRKAIAKAHRRLAEKTGGGADQLEKLAAFLNKGYDSYVHGKYDSAMELFSGRTSTFLMEGTESARNICIAKVSVAGKVGEALNALRLMAMTWPMPGMADEIGAAFNELAASGEQSNDVCDGT